MRKATVLCGVVLLSALMGATCNGLPGGALGGSGGGTARDVVAAFLPDGVGLDVSELPDPDASSAKNKNDNSLMTASPYQRALFTAARVVHDFHRFADKALALGAMVRHDMTDPSQTQVQGHLLINGVEVPYRADFAAFDIDGDGTDDGSGNAVDVPVAIRMWTDNGSGYQQLLCALITTKPSDSNLGAGQVYTRPAAANSEVPVDFQVHVAWDRTDSTHKWNDGFISGQLHDDLKLGNGHQRVDVRMDPADSSLKKTVRSAVDFSTNPYGLQSIQSSVHFEPASGAALVSALATGGGGSISINNQCVTLPEGYLDNTGKCAGFDTQDMAYIDLPAGGETAFPAAFPATPTF